MPYRSISATAVICNPPRILWVSVTLQENGLSAATMSWAMVLEPFAKDRFVTKCPPCGVCDSCRLREEAIAQVTEERYN